MKAIDEYKKKVGMSTRAQAHLLKFQGVLCMLSEKKEYSEAYDHFDKAFKLFHHINSSKGKAICRLAMARCQLDLEAKKDSEEKDINNHISQVEKTMCAFQAIGHKLGAERAAQYIQSLKKQLTGQKGNGIQKLMKFKTFKRNHVESVKADDALVEQNILNDVDIRIFVEVIKEEDDKKDEVRKRIMPRSFSKSNMRTSSVDSSQSLNTNKSSLTMTLSNSKFKKKRIRYLGKIKGFAPKISGKTRHDFKLKTKSIDILNFKSKTSLSRFSSPSVTSIT